MLARCFRTGRSPRAALIPFARQTLLFCAQKRHLSFKEELQIQANRIEFQIQLLLGATAGAAVLSVGFFALLADFVWNGNKNVLCWRVKRRLQAGPKEKTVPLCLLPRVTIPMQPLRLLSTTPVVLCGPHGSGKTTALVEAARHYKAKGIPVAFLRFGSGSLSGDEAGSALLAASTENDDQFGHAAQAFFDSIGYPTSPPLFEQLLHCLRRRVVSLTPEEQKQEEQFLQLRRFKVGMNTLVQALEQLGGEVDRSSSTPSNDGVGFEARLPVVLVDEELFSLLDDGTKEGRGKGNGKGPGRLAFNFFFNTIADRARVFKSFRTVVAKSAPITTATELRNSENIHYVDQPEPSLESVKAALGPAGAGYSEEESKRITDTCGVHLGLLRDFLDATRAR